MEAIDKNDAEKKGKDFVRKHKKLKAALFKIEEG